MPHARPENGHARLLAKLIRQLVGEQQFESLSDLTDALKFRCAKLRVECTPDQVNDAFRLLTSNHALVGMRHVEHPGRRRHDEDAPIARAEASVLWARLNTLIRQKREDRDAVD